jgi:RNA polymerase sigma-70 factor (ECF subfamily)
MAMRGAPGTMAEGELLALASDGDADAFAEIYRRHAGAVLRFARSMTGADDVAEDIAHDTFAALLAAGRRFDASRSAFSTYLYGIVRNLTRARLRRDGRLSALGDLHDVAALDVHSAEEPHERLARARDAAALRRALRRLPSRYREVVILCDLHDVSYEDAARIVHASVPAVRSRLHRARRTLRAALSDEISTRVPAWTPARCLP